MIRVICAIFLYTRITLIFEQCCRKITQILGLSVYNFMFRLFYFKIGCYDKLKEFISGNIIISASIGGGIVLLQVKSKLDYNWANIRFGTCHLLFINLIRFSCVNKYFSEILRGGGEHHHKTHLRSYNKNVDSRNKIQHDSIRECFGTVHLL